MLELISIILLALVLSFDTFAVSVSIGVTDIDVEFKSAIRIAVILAFFQGLMSFIGWIASVTFFISMLGILFGKKLGKYFGNKIDAVGGLILIAVAFKILFSY